MSDAAITATGKAFVLNYRWHFSKSLESYFIGPYARYREVSGTGTAGGAAFDFTIPEWTVGINIGKRWVWDSGVNIVLAAGYGVSTRKEAVSPTNATTGSALATFKKDHPMFLENSSYGEVSIGYVF
jgi:hypothetical protein